MPKKALIALVMALSLLVPLGFGAGVTTRYDITWELGSSVNLTSWFDKDHPMYAELDLEDGLFTTSPYYDPYGSLDPSSKDAVDRCPQWLNESLTLRLLDMDAANRAGYALILNDPKVDESILDEIAYSISDLPTEVLTDSRLDKRLFVENVLSMQRIDSDLDYVRIVDTLKADGWHSTTEYHLEVGNFTIPEDIYYDYLVSPRNAMEVPAYINITTFAYTTQEKGKYWRNYLYDGTDDPGFPVLSEMLGNEKNLWNGTKNQLNDNGAMGAVCRWERACLPQWNVPASRTHQPIVDYWNHMGFCGENSDFLAAASKVALIPCVQIVNFHIPHAWNEFYERGWHAVRAYDGMIDDPNQEGGMGIPAFAMIDPDGTEKDATPLYTMTANLTIIVSDKQGNPVDGALVNLESQPQYFLPELGIVANNTDASGSTGFKIGVGNNFFAHIYSGAGEWPNATSALGFLVPAASPGTNYTFNISLPKRIFTMMDDPVYEEDEVYGIRYTIEANEIRQYTYVYDDPLRAMMNILKKGEGDEKLRVAFLDSANLSLYLSGRSFAPGRLVNLTTGGPVTVVLPIDRTWHPVLIGELQPLTVSYANISISVESSKVNPDAEIVRPLPATYLSTQTIHFEGRMVPDINDPRYTFVWNDGHTNLSTLRSFDMMLPPGHYHFTFTVLFNGEVEDDDDVSFDVVPPNSAPIAVISSPMEDQHLELGTKVQFRSDGSMDPEGADLEYLWRSGDDVLSLNGSFSAYFSLGHHLVVLNVSDGDGGYDEDFVNFKIVPRNNIPQAYIFSPADGSVYYDDEFVTLSANGSIDLETELLTYIWNSSIDGEISQKKNDEVILTSGEHTITLYVGDDVHVGAASVNITVEHRVPPENVHPIAIISSPTDGAHFNITEKIRFDGSASFDPDGAEISIIWSIDGEYVSSDPLFERRLGAGLHTVQLSVGDTRSMTNTTIHIRVIDRIPVPVLLINGSRYDGTILSVIENESVTMDLSGSTDPDGTPLTYRWMVDDSNVSSASVLTISFRPGFHEIYYVIKDGTGLTAAGSVIIEAKPLYEPPEKEEDERERDNALDLMVLVPIAIIASMLLLTIFFLILKRRSKVEEE
jgi:hypothetical protein